MPISLRTVRIDFKGEINSSDIFAVAFENGFSPGRTEFVDFVAATPKVITVPKTSTTPEVVVKGLTIVFNSAIPSNPIITLKGVDTDTGIRMKGPDPTSIAIDPLLDTITMVSDISTTRVRFIWT